MAKRARSRTRPAEVPLGPGSGQRADEAPLAAAVFTRRDVLKAAIAAPLGAAALSGAAVTLDRFPYLQNVTSDAATLVWTTRQPGAGSVAFSSDNSFSSSAPAAVQTYTPSITGRPYTFNQFQARLTGLREGVQYFYRILVDAQT